MTARIYPSQQDTYLTAIGSLLVTYEEVNQETNFPKVECFVNSIERKLIHNNNNNLYSTFLSNGDIVRILITTTSNVNEIDVTRRDYTTDDQGGDMGIRDVYITGVTGNSPTTLEVTFTVSPISLDYNFEYLVSASVQYPATPTPTPTPSATPIPCPTNIDLSFNSGQSGITFAVFTTEVQSDGSVLVGGDFEHYNGINVPNLIKLNSDGTLNTTSIGTGFNGDVLSTFTTSDNKIMVVGNFTQYNGVSVAKGICRLNSDLTLDTGFNAGSGLTWSNTTFANYIEVKQLPNNNLIIYGDITKYNGTIGSIFITDVDGTLLYNATLQNYMSGSGIYENGYVTNAYVVDYDKIIIGGGLMNRYSTPILPRITITGLLKVNSDLSVNTNYWSIYGSYILPQTFILNPDNTINMFGYYSGSTLSGFNGNLKLNSNGQYDNTYVTSIGGHSLTDDANIYDIIRQQDGSVLICGQIESVDNTYNVTGLAKFDNDGNFISNEVEFPYLGYSFYHNSLSIQSDNKIIVGGQFTQPDCYTIGGILRLKATPIGPIPSPTVTRTVTPTPTLTPTPVTPTPSPTVTPSITPTNSLTPTITPTPTLTPSITPTNSLTPTITPTPTLTPLPVYLNFSYTGTATYSSTPVSTKQTDFAITFGSVYNPSRLNWTTSGSRSTNYIIPWSTLSPDPTKNIVSTITMCKLAAGYGITFVSYKLRVLKNGVEIYNSTTSGGGTVSTCPTTITHSKNGGSVTVAPGDTLTVQWTDILN